MLRWCQSTARALNKRGITSVLTRELHAESSKSVTQKAISLIYCTYVTRNINGYLNDKQSSSIPELDSIIIEPASPKGSRSSLTAFITLSDFLSCKDPRSYPKKYSLDTLKLLYNTVKAQGQLELLSSKHLTELISLFGTLSLPDPRNGLIYISKLAPHVTSKGDDTEKWDFLIEVARDKQKTLKMKLNGTDGFWLMRALLTKVVLAEGETSLSPGDPREQALSEATQHYLRIWKHAYDIEIHLPLLQKWFDLGSQKETAALVNRLCRVLELHIYPNSRLTEVLWRLILRKTLPLGAALKSRILSMINTRLSPQFDETRQAFGAKKKKNNPSYSPPSQLPEGSNNFSTVELGNALGTALFPAPGAAGTQMASKEVRDWATEQARQAFAPAVTQDVQWSNLLLLAIHQSERLNIPLSPNPQAPQSQIEEDTTRSHESRSESHSEPESEPNGDWRPVLLLNALERTTNGGTITESSTRESVQGVVRPLWVTWKAGGEHTSRSLDVNTSRPIAAAFFRLAAKIVDGPLAEACYRFCVKHDLFRNTEILAEGAVHSWADLNAAYVLAVATCRGVGWQVAFEETEISGSRDLVLSTVFHHYVLTDLRVGYQVYRYAVMRSYKLSGWPVYLMGMKLAEQPRTWRLAVPLLERYKDELKRKSTEELVVAILRTLQTERIQQIEPALAKILGDTLWRLYEDTTPPIRYKYPIRFFFSIMIASDQPARAIAIVEAIHRNADPTFFTTRLLLRLMRTLVRYRYIHLTHRVHKLVSKDPKDARAAADFRRKMTIALAKAGAHTAAKRAYGAFLDLKKIKIWRTPREAMIHAVRFKMRKPDLKHTLPVVGQLKRAPTHPPTIKFAISLLIRADRHFAARKILEGSLKHLDNQMVTNIGNMFLDGLFRKRLLRNGRLVRQVMHTKEYLVTKFGFQPDRITTNIMIKSLLRWRIVDAVKIRGLFDHMIQCGYPMSEQWQARGTTVPFGTSAADFQIDIPNAQEKIVFQQHVRPLYKMFVTALFTRGDKEGARTVVGILKEEEGRAMGVRQTRNKARLDGIMRKKAGIVKSKGKKREL